MEVGTRDEGGWLTDWGRRRKGCRSPQKVDSEREQESGQGNPNQGGRVASGTAVCPEQTDGRTRRCGGWAARSPYRGKVDEPEIGLAGEVLG